MTPRAIWKGYLKVAELTCPVALYSASSISERIAFHIINRKTGHRIHRQFIDSETGKPVASADQVKGYETARRQYVIVEPGEIAAAIPDSDKTLAIQAFIRCGDIDDLYFGRPYYLAPGSAAADETFAVLRESMCASKTAAIARTLLFRRVRTLLLRADGKGIVAAALNFDYEIQSAQAVFGKIPKIEVRAEMLDLAKHIIKTKRGKFDAKSFDDRYERALAEIVRAKLDGKPVNRHPQAAPSKVVDLMEALRKSAASGRSRAPGGSAKSAKTSRETAVATPKRKIAKNGARASALRRKAS